MSTAETEGMKGTSRLGVRGRLLLAFFGIAAFAVLAAAAGLYAFREVGGRLAVIEYRVPRALSALELSRTAERLIAAAPALLAAEDRGQRDQVMARLAPEVERLESTLEVLTAGAGVHPPGDIAPLVAELTGKLERLDALVSRRLEASERIAVLRRRAFRVNSETERLLAPWLEVVGSQVRTLAAEAGAGASVEGSLSTLVETQRRLLSVRSQVSAVADMLAEASTAERPRRLQILSFQLDLALRGLEEGADGLDARLRRLLRERLRDMRALAIGPDALVAARREELKLVAEGEALLERIGELSGRLSTAVDRLGGAAKAEVADAVRDALSVQQFSSRALVLVVLLSLITSVLIVWLYVGRSIARRLTTLSEKTLAIAGGRLNEPVVVEGRDEIAAMGRALEVFRINTRERDELLADKARTAERLEEEVRHRTAELAEKGRELEAANRYKKQFLTSASHDLRQPLHALNLLVAQLGGETDPVERSRLVDRINAAVSSMNELFEALLDMSKLDAGVLETNVSEFPVAPLLARMETTFADTAREKGLRLRVVPSDAWVRSDPILLERILLNLVSNALRYTTRGGVFLGCRRRGGNLRIDVRDSGIGISETQQRRMFKEFIQFSSPRDGRRLGLGYGLSVVERLARLLDHPIDVRSQVGRGTRFSVAVPAVAVRAGDGEPRDAAPTDLVGGAVVVVIDDDRTALDAMADILRDWDCEVIEAESGDEALAALTERMLAPDTVIADYRLIAGETGIDAIRRIRRQCGVYVPALLVSGDTLPESTDVAREHGIHLLRKPLPPMRLRAILHRLLQGASKAGAPSKEHE